MRALRDFGLEAEAWWVGNFLQDRRIRVKEGEALSDPVTLERGVPQGSVLGPLLWSLVLDRLLRKLDNACSVKPKDTMAVPIAYADNVFLAIRCYDPDEAIERGNELLQLITDWSLESGVPIGQLEATWINGSASRTPWPTTGRS